MFDVFILVVEQLIAYNTIVLVTLTNITHNFALMINNEKAFIYVFTLI